MNKTKTKNKKNVANHIITEIVKIPSHVIVLAINKNSLRNMARGITCKSGIPLLRAYVYDAIADSYDVECVDFMKIGLIPVSCKMHIEECGWHINIPLPEAILFDYFTENQKSDIEMFKSSANTVDCKIEYLQMVSCF